MKAITREVTTYEYTFAKVDVKDGIAYDIHTITTTSPLSQRRLNEICKESNGAICIGREQNTQKYAMPLDLFVETCKKYAAENTGEELSEEDE